MTCPLPDCFSEKMGMRLKPRTFKLRRIPAVGLAITDPSFDNPPVDTSQPIISEISFFLTSLVHQGMKTQGLETVEY